MAEISVGPGERTGRAMSFEVTVSEGGNDTTHRIAVSESDLERLSRPGETPEQFVRRCFEFLLRRESKESIMREFDVSVIARYFPEFEREIGA